MKSLILFFLTFYKMFVSPVIHQMLGIQNSCRFVESCSAYSSRVIKQYGILSGLRMALRRLLACQPFAKQS